MSSMLLRYQAVRAHTGALAAVLSPEDSTAQSMPDASPAKWHLAHTTWFFETFVLLPYLAGYEAAHPAYRVLFNSYYDGVGARHPRAQRGLLTRPSLQEVLAFRHNVDERMLELLSLPVLPPSLTALVELGLHHEQQHQELLLTDIQHLLSCNPLWPAYSKAPMPRSMAPTHPFPWLKGAQGVVEIGHSPGAGFAFDNESPRHRVYLAPHEVAGRLSTNAEYAAFVADGGYTQPQWWLAEGWDWRSQQQLSHPLYWYPSNGQWQAFGLYGMQPLDMHAPVVHMSFFEADAFARWSGARLPTEAEWESAASTTPLPQHAPANPMRLLPHTTADDPQQWHGQVWQWTQSSYAPYPGFQVAEGAVGEYNGKFMVNQYVLRGSSCATPPGHSRHSYRNFFPATARWQFAGVRLARDV